MIRCDSVPVLWPARVPRIRGDDPSHFFAGLLIEDAFPAYAGMIRPFIRFTTAMPRVPRIRGDDPQVLSCFNQPVEAFPAYAGMIRIVPVIRCSY